MNHNPEKVKQKIESILSEMSEQHWLFTNRPGRDFMRQNLGKLSFYDTMRLILSMGKEKLSDEIISYFDMDINRISSSSAFIQRRKQISAAAFKYLFSEFAAAFPQVTHQFKDHCILAADGTHVVYATNAQILEDYNKPHMTNHKGYNHMHLNAFAMRKCTKSYSKTSRNGTVFYSQSTFFSVRCSVEHLA